MNSVETTKNNSSTAGRDDVPGDSGECVSCTRGDQVYLTNRPCEDTTKPSVKQEDRPSLCDSSYGEANSGQCLEKVEEQSSNSGSAEEESKENENKLSPRHDEKDRKWSKAREAISFEDMNLKKELLRGIFAYSLEKPLTIQQLAILPCIAGDDVIAQSQSGTGKTTSFSISILQKIDTSLHAPQALILVPTKELAMGIQSLVVSLGAYMGVKAVVGGSSVRGDVHELDDRAHVIIGCPGRVYDLIKRKTLDVSHVQMFVLDEADDMLNHGFKDQINDIFRTLGKDVQVILLSATMPCEVLDITKNFMRNPTHILLNNMTVNLNLSKVKQFYVDVGKEEWKLETLWDLLQEITTTQTVIFCNTVRKVKWLAHKMKGKEFTVSVIQGDLQSYERDFIIRECRKGASLVLIMTDVLAHGMDVYDLLFINYDIPTNTERYIHRVGVSGHYDRRYIAINLITEDDHQSLKNIETYYNTQVQEMPVDISNFF